MAEDTPLSAEDSAALAAAFNNTTPFDQIRTNLNPENGQYDITIMKLEPALDQNKLYIINGEYQIAALGAPTTGPATTYRRTMYVGTKKDKLAQQPDTRLNSPGLRFFTAIMEANGMPKQAQTDAAMCQSLLGKRFGCRIAETKYTKDGQEKTGSDFGRNVTPVGKIPAKLDREAATVATAAPTAAAAGAKFE